MANEVSSASGTATLPALGATVPQHLAGTGSQAPVPVQPVAGTTQSEDVVRRAAQRVVDSLTGGNSFAFIVDKQSGMTIVKVYNKVTGELVRQIPTEEIVHLAQIMRQEEQQPVLDVLA